MVEINKIWRKLFKQKTKIEYDYSLLELDTGYLKNF